MKSLLLTHGDTAGSSPNAFAHNHRSSVPLGAVLDADGYTAGSSPNSIAHSHRSSVPLGVWHVTPVRRATV